MIARCMLIFAGLLMAGLVGSFFLYISALALLTSIVIMIGLIATLALGFWAGLNSSTPLARDANQGGSLQVINAPGDQAFLPNLPAEDRFRAANQ